MAAKRFGELFSLSWERLLSKKKQLIIPAIFGGGLQSCNMGSGGGGGDSTEQMQDAGESVSLFVSKAYAQATPESVNTDLMLWIGLIVIVIFLIIFTVVFTAHLYALHVVYDQHSGFKSTLTKSLRSFFPVIGIGFWKFFRSFVWAPLSVIVFSGIWIGYSLYSKDIVPTPGISLIALSVIAWIALALYFNPRMQFATLLYITKDATGVIASVQQSMNNTVGYWGKVIGNSILFALCQLAIMVGAAVCALLVVLSGVFFVMLLPESLQALLFIAGIALLIVFVLVLYFAAQYMTFWGKCFLYELWLTIVQNPRVPKKKA